jgi:hypothetical protein
MIVHPDSELLDCRKSCRSEIEPSAGSSNDIIESRYDPNHVDTAKDAVLEIVGHIYGFY